MALTPTNPPADEAFVREVDEEMRRDQALEIWRDYGKWIIAAIVGALAILAAMLYWQHHSEVAAGEQGEKFQSAFDDLSAGKMEAVKQPLADLSGSKIDGYRAVAKFTQADVLLSRQDAKGAAAKFAEIANDSGLSKPFRDLALIRQTATEYDTLKPNVIIARLQPLAEANSAWLGSAGEMLAVAYLNNNQPQMAGQVFGRVARGENVPPSIRQRAVQMAGVLGIDAVDPKNQEAKAQ